MIGGGLGGFAPGEWTDDTSQTYAVAAVAATGADLRTEGGPGPDRPRPGRLVRSAGHPTSVSRPGKSCAPPAHGPAR